MTFLLSLPILALGLLGAHFYRATAWPLAALCVLLVLLLAWPRPWVARGVQAALALGSLEWLWTLVLLVQQRASLGQPWLRLSLILGAVAVFTGGTAMVFRHRRLRARYRLDGSASPNGGAA